ncbi:hypothetical protein HLPCO_002946 [Haloplasma contractile SSD-17B]|uniref:Uncharacterized protein n=1 Tax=Haloplasma contractile SSD-17B TaxID=1033810 RepID=U2E703_9MOLU|nr:hypothetical protein HLPCO_002946 [Haloplasma contractile SSD-17B]
MTYNRSLTIFSTSFSSGNRSNSFLENINSSSNFTSYTPPEDGIKLNEVIDCGCLSRTRSARPTALFK